MGKVNATHPMSAVAMVVFHAPPRHPAAGATGRGVLHGAASRRPAASAPLHVGIAHGMPAPHWSTGSMDDGGECGKR